LGDRVGWLPIPRQETGDTFVWVVGDTRKDIAQISFGIDAIELGGFDERVHGGGSFAAGIGAGFLPMAAPRNARSAALLSRLSVCTTVSQRRQEKASRT
jgi:hypothetical protein